MDSRKLVTYILIVIGSSGMDFELILELTFVQKAFLKPLKLLKVQSYLRVLSIIKKFIFELTQISQNRLALL